MTDTGSRTFEDLDSILARDAKRSIRDRISEFAERKGPIGFAKMAAAAGLFYASSLMIGESFDRGRNLAPVRNASVHLKSYVDLVRPNIVEGEPFEVDGKVFSLVRDNINTDHEPYASKSLPDLNARLDEIESINGKASAGVMLRELDGFVDDANRRSNWVYHAVLGAVLSVSAGVLLQRSGSSSYAYTDRERDTLYRISRARAMQHAMKGPKSQLAGTKHESDAAEYFATLYEKDGSIQDMGLIWGEIKENPMNFTVLERLAADPLRYDTPEAVKDELARSR